MVSVHSLQTFLSHTLYSNVKQKYAELHHFPYSYAC